LRALAGPVRVRRTIVVALLVLIDCEPAPPTWASCRRIDAPAVQECSGIIQSRRQPGVLWVHNDSGDSARFFALDANGALLAEVRVDGARNVDWEDITTDDAGHLYIGDFGNNRNMRRDLCVYVVDEPDVLGAKVPLLRVPVLRTLRFRYADQTAFPDGDRLNFDCEAMFWEGGALWLLTKHRSDIRTTLYRLDPNSSAEQVLEPLAGADIGSPVTAAGLSRDGRFLAVLSYQYIHLFERPSGARGDASGARSGSSGAGASSGGGAGRTFIDWPSHATLIEGRQCEGLCFDGDRVLFTNEQREIYCVPVNFLQKHDRYLPQPPQARLPRVEPRVDGRAGEWHGEAGRLRFDRFTSAAEAAPAGGAAARRDTADVRVGWDPRGVLLHVRWRPPLGAERPVAYVMLGPDAGSRPCLLPEQTAWAAAWKSDTLALEPLAPEPEQPPCAPPLAPPPATSATRRHGDEVEFEALIPVAGVATLAPGKRLLLNVVLRTGDAAGECAWAAVLDMQPLGNPLLWGHAVLDPAGVR
jgi:hypothetical protein